jgi:hypothetical protein
MQIFSDSPSSLSPPLLPNPPPPSQWKRLVTDTELMDLLAPTDEHKSALHARDMQHCPQTAVARAIALTNDDLDIPMSEMHELSLARAFVAHKFPVTLPAHYNPAGMPTPKGDMVVVAVKAQKQTSEKATVWVEFLSPPSHAGKQIQLYPKSLEPQNGPAQEADFSLLTAVRAQYPNAKTLRDLGVAREPAKKPWAKVRGAFGVLGELKVVARAAEANSAANHQQDPPQGATLAQAPAAEEVSENRSMHGAGNARLQKPAHDPLQLGAPNDAQASEADDSAGHGAEPIPVQKEPEEKRGFFSRLLGKNKRPRADEEAVAAGRQPGVEGEMESLGQEADSEERVPGCDDWETMLSNDQLGIVDFIHADPTRAFATKAGDQAEQETSAAHPKDEKEMSWEEYQEHVRKSRGKPTFRQRLVDKFKVMRHRQRTQYPSCDPCCGWLDYCFLAQPAAESKIHYKGAYPFKNIFGKTVNTRSRRLCMRIANSTRFELLWLLTNWAHMALLILDQELKSYQLPSFTPLVLVGLYLLEVSCLVFFILLVAWSGLFCA